VFRRWGSVERKEPLFARELEGPMADRAGLEALT
jgi:hypothetical protein